MSGFRYPSIAFVAAKRLHIPALRLAHNQSESKNRRGIGDVMLDIGSSDEDQSACVEIIHMHLH